MGFIYASIELINEYDVELARRHSIGEEEIKKINIRVLVDTGAITLAINENIQEFLQLPVVGKRRFITAEGKAILCDEVSGALIKFRNRDTSCRAIVLPGDTEPLLGVIPMEAMDIIVHPTREELIVNPEHPDEAVLKLAGFKLHWID